MAAEPVHFEDQLKLIMECRSSGLSDHQWCLEHNIKPGTFYNWIKHHKKRGSMIPAPQRRRLVPQFQDVVRLEPEVMQKQACEPFYGNGNVQQSATMELSVDGVVLRVTNDIRPELLAQTLHILKGLSC